MFVIMVEMMTLFIEDFSVVISSYVLDYFDVIEMTKNTHKIAFCQKMLKISNICSKQYISTVYPTSKLFSA